LKLPKSKTAVNVGVVTAAVVATVALGAVAWPALTRPDPPAEAAGDGGLRIRLVQPPKAPVPRAGPLDVGLSDAAQAMAKSPAAPFAATPTPASARSPWPVDDQWERERTGSGFELARQMREQEWAASRERERREAQEQADSDRRWEEDRERDRYDERRYDDHDDPPLPPDDDRPPPGWR